VAAALLSGWRSRRFPPTGRLRLRRAPDTSRRLRNRAQGRLRNGDASTLGRCAALERKRDRVSFVRLSIRVLLGGDCRRKRMTLSAPEASKKAEGFHFFALPLPHL